MCGIGGIIGWKGAPDVLTQAIHSMQKALLHRGPDDEGTWFSRDGSAALCHRRLSILDLTSAGHQPMAHHDLRIVFNGEIYNFRQLRGEGEKYSSATDTEVLLHEYEREGSGCTRRLEGMFAFAIYNEAEESLFLARDSFGIKPLYYTEQEGVFIFASEVRALLASGIVSEKICPEGVNGFLRTGSVPEPHTLIKGVKMLPAGSTLMRKANGSIAIQSDWEIKFPDSIHDADSALKVTREALHDTIARHFVSDVPVGIFLSGGVDSSAIAGIAAQQGRSNIHTYSIGVDDPDFDESSDAAIVAAQWGTTHHEMRLTRSLAHELFQGYLHAQDQPSVDGFNTYCISHFAHQLGAKVVLSGLGGDEIFGGYASFRRIPKYWQYSRMLNTGRFPVRQLGAILEKNASRATSRRIGEWLGTAPSASASYHLTRSVFSRYEALAISRQMGLPDCDGIHISPSLDKTAEDSVSRLELTRYMRNQLLRDSDVMSMAFGLELRVPLVDEKFFSAVSAIAPSIRLQPGKKLLVAAAGCIPDFVANSPKRGFSFPLQKWFGGEMAASLEQKFSLPLIPWYRAWTLLTLECWLKTHKLF